MKLLAPLKFIAVTLVAYLIFRVPGYISGAPIPASLVSIYMFFVIVTLLLAMTATDEGAKKLFGPFKEILLSKKNRLAAFILLLILPLLFAYKTFAIMNKSQDAPVELRVIHPTPPRRLVAFEKSYNLSDLENPYRRLEGSEAFRALVKEGGVLYYKNCVGCHGAQLDGRGHLAGGLHPAPLPFIGSDTIAQLTESYLFWRIVKGGAGLPQEARPRMSAMPAWEEELSEADTWKVILFLYDYTGNSPRAWAVKKTKKAHISPTGRRIRRRDKALEGLTSKARGRILYDNYCWWCHGKEGYGDGPAVGSSAESSTASRMMPPPRDLTDGTYKFKTTPYDEFYPSDDDIVRAISDGLRGTAMAGWKDVLSAEEVQDLVVFLKELAMMEQPENLSIEYGKAAPATAASVANGKKLFEDRCTECHGNKGRGDTSKSLKDDWGFRTWPGNLTRPGGLKRSGSAKQVYARITTGIAGTQMPSFADLDNKKSLTMKERWDVANFVMTLKADYKKIDHSELIRAVRSEALPSSPVDELWNTATFKTFNLSPNADSKKRLLTPTLGAVSVKAIYNEREVALLLEWDDPTRSVPGSKEARKIIGAEPMADTLELRFSEGFDDPQDSAAAIKAELRRPLDFKGSGVFAWTSTADNTLSAYKDGTWRVVVRRLLGDDFDGVLPMAIALRDGSNMEEREKYVTTGWLWLAFAPDKGASKYLVPVGVFLITLVLELLWLRGSRQGEDVGL